MISLETLEGKWHIIFTNFPMWLKGDKTTPTFNYRIEKRGEMKGLFDEVKYIKNGRSRSIVGFDKPTNETNTRFTWKGRGILGLLSSNWSIEFMSKDAEWALISFEKTLFTPAGFDVITRSENPSVDLLKTIGNELMNRGLQSLSKID